MKTLKPADIDAYIAAFPDERQAILEQIRAKIKTVVPEASEAISYGMPSFTLNNQNLVYFSAFKSHIGFYGLPEGDDAFQEAITPYKAGKGTLQFPLNEPMPLDLIAQIVLFKKYENEKKKGK
jgi:uncharacterized protein YdhG (YjbR/CyaY superfamily)